MKNLIILIAALVVTSCDPQFHDDFIIVNDCNEDINVSVIHQNGNNQIFSINSQTENLFFVDEWVGGASKFEKIDDIFQKITITKDDVVSKINYANHNLWREEKMKNSKKNGYYTSVKYYLIVNYEDFEDDE